MTLTGFKLVQRTVLDALIIANFIAVFSSILKDTDTNVSTSDELKSIFYGCVLSAFAMISGKILLPAVFDVLRLSETRRSRQTSKEDDEKLVLAENHAKEKFIENSTFLVPFTIFTLGEIDIFSNVDFWDEGKQINIWKFDSETTYPEGTPEDFTKKKINQFYCFVIGFWLASVCYMRFALKIDKQWLFMYLHHALSCSLVCGSYLTGQRAIGVMIMFVHDFPDIFLCLCQMAHFLNWDLQHLGKLPLAEILFAINMIVWAYLRLWILPSVLIKTCIVDLPHHAAFFRDGSYATQMFTHFLQCCISGLWCMHVSWFWAMVKILVKVLSGDDSTEEISAEYFAEDSDRERKKSKEQ